MNDGRSTASTSADLRDGIATDGSIRKGHAEPSQSMSAEGRGKMVAAASGNVSFTLADSVRNADASPDSPCAPSAGSSDAAFVLPGRSGSEDDPVPPAATSINREAPDPSEHAPRNGQRLPPVPPRNAASALLPVDNWTPLLRFTGVGKEYFLICLKNLVLILVTLGIYTPWAITNCRRYIWENTHLMGDPLEYTGKGMEIFLGFILITVGLASLPFMSLILSEEMLPFFAVFYLFLLFFLRFYFTYTALRYRLSRSLWRGIRGAVSGSPFTYTLKCFWWLFLSVLIGGLYFPFYQANRVRALANNAWFGSRRFIFLGKGTSLLGYIILTVIVGIVVALGVGVFFQLTIPVFPESSSGWPDTAVLFFSLCALLLVGLPLYSFYRYKVFKWFFGHLIFDAMRFRSRLSSLPTVARVVACAILVVCTFGLAWPFVSIYMTRYLMESIDYTGNPKLDELLQSAEKAPKFGDGAFDALGLDFGI